MLEKFLVNKYCLYLLILVFVFTGCQSIESTIESTTVNTNESAQTLIGKSILNQKVEPLRTAAIGNNLLTNGDFESNLEGWTSCNSADNIKVSPDGQNNTQAISVSADCFYQSVNINPNDNLTLSCNAKVIDEQGWTGFGLTFSDANWNQLSASDSVQISGSTYNDYSLTMNAPANAQYASMWLYSADTALVDNCSLMLETVTSPPPSSQQFTCDVKNNSRWNTAFYMPGYTVEGLEPDYIPTNLQLSLDYQTGTALLSGEIVHFSDTNKKWSVDINYQGRTITAPINNPSAPTDVEWSYYPTRTGSLKGLGDYAGITLNLVDNPDYEPALQIGLGGNTVHPEFGARHEMYYANPDNISEGIWSEWTYGLECTEITEPPAPPAPPATCVNPISIPDPELAKSIREELNLLNSEAITCEVLEQLFSVSTRANDLTGLEFATNLYYIWSINFSDAGADLSALKDLPNLKNITLTGANNWDIETIKDLDLTTLTTDFVSIPNINGLENLTNLTTLSLTAPANTTNIDLSPLNNLVNLQELKLQNINSNDYSIIGQLTSLTSLFLNPSFEFANSSQIDVTFVSSLTNLENLLLSNTELQNTNLIANLTNLRTLSLFPNELTDISGLENLVSLVELTLSSNNITSSELNSLSNLINLQKLILLDNDITDLTVLSNLTSIETLSLGFNAITELAPLRALSNLQNLNIVFTGVCSPNNLAKVENAAFVRELRLRGATISQTPGELTQCSEL